MLASEAATNVADRFDRLLIATPFGASPTRGIGAICDEAVKLCLQGCPIILNRVEGQCMLLTSSHLQSCTHRELRVLKVALW